MITASDMNVSIWAGAIVREESARTNLSLKLIWVVLNKRAMREIALLFFCVKVKTNDFFCVIISLMYNFYERTL